MTRRPDRGSATIWVLAAAALLLVVSGVAVLRAAAVLARHRAEAAADVAALAAAGRLGTGEPPCPAAARIAAGNGARLIGCRVRAGATLRSGVVDVTVALPIRLPGAGRWTVRATARAGRRGEPQGRPGAPVDLRAAGSAPNSVWHAGARRPLRASVLETRGRRRTGKVNAWRSRCRRTLPKTSRS